jgi:hypothetical protein
LGPLRKEATMKGTGALLALACVVTLPGAPPAWPAPPSAENARACREQAIKAHPTQLAGAAQGSAQAQRAYFQQCIAERQAKAKKRRAP